MGAGGRRRAALRLDISYINSWITIVGLQKGDYISLGNPGLHRDYKIGRSDYKTHRWDYVVLGLQMDYIGVTEGLQKKRWDYKKLGSRITKKKASGLQKITKKKTVGIIIRYRHWFGHICASAQNTTYD